MIVTVYDIMILQIVFVILSVVCGISVGISFGYVVEEALEMTDQDDDIIPRILGVIAWIWVGVAVGVKTYHQLLVWFGP